MKDSRSDRLKAFLSKDSLPQKEIVPPAPPSPPVTSQVSDQQISFGQIFAEPRSIEDTRIPPSFLADLALKTLYFGGTMASGEVAQALHLHFSGVVDPILRELKAQHLVEVLGGSGLSAASYKYAITNKGGERARER